MTARTPGRLTAPAPGTTALLRAGGAPIDMAVAEAAADWFTRLHSGTATAAERARWRRWHDAHADHARAWQHLQSITGALPELNAGGLGYHALHSAPRLPSRRHLLGMLVGVGTAAGAGWVATHSPQWQQLAADYRSGTGESQHHRLPDGTQLLLGTRSAVALHFTGTERRVRLLQGEALFTTGHPGGELGSLPFLVETAEGHVRALGTRFTVRQNEGATQVAVFEGAVEIHPAGAPAGAIPLRLDAGQAVSFGRSRAQEPTAAGERELAWSRGLLWVDNQRLDVFLTELDRYRSGWLRVDPAVAGLRFSGVFPLGAAGGQADTDAVLAMLPNSLPVQVRWRTRWWVVVEAAAPAGR